MGPIPAAVLPEYTTFSSCSTRSSLAHLRTSGPEVEE